MKRPGLKKEAGPEEWISHNTSSFHPETVLFCPGGVNLRDLLCGVLMVASASSLDFLAGTKKSSFPNWKLIVLNPVFPVFPDEN
jgi:hypothetical protein